MLSKRHLKKTHSKSIHHSPKLETTQMSINSRRGKLWYSHTEEYYTATKKKKTTDKPNHILLRERSQMHKSTYNTYDSISTEVKNRQNESLGTEVTFWWWCR